MLMDFDLDLTLQQPVMAMVTVMASDLGTHWEMPKQTPQLLVQKH